MKYKNLLLAPIACVLCCFASCHSIDDYDNDMLGNFDALWTFVDTRYCFFDQKDIDWDDVRDRYRPRAAAAENQRALFMIMSEMLDELRDGHVNLSSWMETSYYRKWWSDYPQNYDSRLVEEHYFDFNYHSLGGAYYDIIKGQNIGYVRLSTFEHGLGDSNWLAIFTYFKTCSGIIIDVRDNGGGSLTNVEEAVSHFIDHEILAGYMMHKTGPGHSDFSEPYAYTYKPSALSKSIWTRPVVVLTNRSTFSAANNFVSIMKTLDNVTIVGDVTGGGSGMPISSELPCGWGIRISSCRILDAAGNDTEFGVEPSEGYRVNLDPKQALYGIDTIIETAVAILNK